MSQHEKNNFWMPTVPFPEGIDYEYDERRRMLAHMDQRMTPFPYPGALTGFNLDDENIIPYQAEPLIGKKLWLQMTRNDVLASLPKEPYPNMTEEELRECGYNREQEYDDGSRE